MTHRGQMEKQFERDPHPSYVRIGVGDEGPAGAVGVNRGRGRRGLEIVNALSLSWGSYTGSTNVWAKLPIVPSTGRP